MSAKVVLRFRISTKSVNRRSSDWSEEEGERKGFEGRGDNRRVASSSSESSEAILGHMSAGKGERKRWGSLFVGSKRNPILVIN